MVMTTPPVTWKSQPAVTAFKLGTVLPPQVDTFNFTMSFGGSVGDLASVPQFAWRVYKACRDSSGDFVELSGEVESMHAALNEIGALISRCTLNEERIGRLAVLLRGCHGLLKDIESQLAKYKSLGTDKKRIRDKVRWGMEAVGDVRIRLVSHTAMLALFSSSLLAVLKDIHVHHALTFRAACTTYLVGVALWNI
ncbi:hypothetical protein FGG08_005737 [Glutinoglossum americanum]|uniref:Uncharacterized protein n=1 Tax=Glutinoglossum americanum TaxID=1670608 RepID=A0A9P8L2M4_9PEZI|nr:hypothetical protein FGG08_005737 [Glutinoglossum americanum]